MNVLLLGYVQDLQTGVYIIEACNELQHTVNWIDIRAMFLKLSKEATQLKIIENVNNLKEDPDLVIVLKGIEMTHETVEYVKNKFPKAKLINWFFDVYFTTKKIWEDKDYFKTIKLFDYYFCSVHGVVKELNKLGMKNAIYLEEACSPMHNEEQILNNFQKKKYGADIGFVGTLGFMTQHANRIPIIKRITEEGFNLKIWGKIVCAPKYLTREILKSHTYTAAINEQHSMVVQSTLINLGIDQNPEIYQAHSARLYRVLCAGGLYLLNGTKGMEDIFKINKPGEQITEEQELVLYYNKEDLIEKLDFLLQHEDLCHKIGKNGQKRVLERDTFVQRIKKMENVIKNEN